MHVITTTEGLDPLIAQLSTESYLTVDTEFLRDKTYYPILCLIQIATERDVFVIDALSETLDLSRLKDLFTGPVLKVFHSARQDLEILYQQLGVVVAPFFDTQIAAMLCGLGEAVSYGSLALECAGVKLDKSHQFTDWSRRPLSAKQLRYAADDVLYLRTVFDVLSDRLRSMGRMHWCEEESLRITAPSMLVVNQDTAWEKLASPFASRQALAVIRALAQWRDQVARTLNVPKGFVLTDGAISKFSSHPPHHANEIARDASHTRIEWNEELREEAFLVITRALQSDSASWPSSRKDSPDFMRSAALDLLKGLRQCVADRLQVAERILASDAELRTALAGGRELSCLCGWKREAFGNDLLAVLAGEKKLGLEGGKVVVR